RQKASRGTPEPEAEKGREEAGRKDGVEEGEPKTPTTCLLPERPAMVLVVVMGVSGSGKSTVGTLLADKLGWKFYEGDDYHPEENRKKMAEGIPLTDQDRIPWLCHLHEILMRFNLLIIKRTCIWTKCHFSLLSSQKNVSVHFGDGEAGCQSLNNQQEEKESTPRKILFVHLAGPIELIASRLEKRRGHFMPPSLLQSQFDTLEPPCAPENFITVSLEKPVSETVSEIERHLKSLY
ncbi:hypothetical protein E2320_017353, partial [Naja naja]